MWQQHLQQTSPFIQMNDGESVKTSIPQMYRTPIKRAPIILNSELTSSPTPFRFDFNFYFGHLFSSGHLPITQALQDSSQPQRKENYVFFRSSLDKSGYKITPGSEYKVKEKISNSNENVNTQNMENFDGNSMKKNLNQIFDNAKNDKNEKKAFEEAKNKAQATYFFGSPTGKNNQQNSKKIFECSGSTMFNSTDNKLLKKKRFRKNEDQLKRLAKFFKENKEWTKSEIKRISEETGLKDTKVYKWLWDQKNKEIKGAKFFVDKKK